jgi:hypothetical protein
VPPITGRVAPKRRPGPSSPPDDDDGVTRMTAKDLAFVFCRAFALVLVFGQLLPLEGLQYTIAMIEQEWMMGGAFTSLLAIALPLALLLLPSIVLWKKADWLSGKIVSGSSVSSGSVSGQAVPAGPGFESAAGESPSPGRTLSAHVLQRVVFSGIGMLMIVGGLRKLWAESARALLVGREQGLDAATLSPTNIADAAFLLACGLVLLFGAGRVIAFIRFLRHAGR